MPGGSLLRVGRVDGVISGDGIIAATGVGGMVSGMGGEGSGERGTGLGCWGPGVMGGKGRGGEELPGGIEALGVMLGIVGCIWRGSPVIV